MVLGCNRKTCWEQRKQNSSFGWFIIICDLFETYIRKSARLLRILQKNLKPKLDLSITPKKIINTGYTIDTITFDGVMLKTLSDLSEFAIDYVYGVDARRSLYFGPRVAEINEQARFWVGKHLDSYVPHGMLIK